MSAAVSLRIAASLLLLSTLGCTQEKKNAAVPPDPSATPAPAGAAASATGAIPPRLDGTRALQYVRELVALGPRPVGSAAHKKMERYIAAKLGSTAIEYDPFTQTTSAGDFPMRNIIAKFPGKKDGVIVLASHYDTKQMPEFVGANDGGSSTAVLLAIADQLRATTKGGRRDGHSVWLVFFDGEEALGPNITDSDGLYGSRHLAKRWQQDGTAKKVKAFILADMIGDTDLQVLRDQNSTPWLLDLIGAAAERLGYQSHFFQTGTAMLDDHVPFQEAGVPVVDLIDFDYGYANAFWHTKEDTLDKISSRSLEIVGNVMLQAVWMLDQR